MRESAVLAFFYFSLLLVQKIHEKHKHLFSKIKSLGKRLFLGFYVYICHDV